MTKEQARETFYGMSQEEWKSQHQTPASDQKQAEFKTAFRNNVKDQ